MKRLYLIAFVSLSSGCATLQSASTVGAVANSLTGSREQQKIATTELRQLQIGEFQESKQVVFTAAMATLMDLEYRIQSADVTTGLIVANAPSIDRVKLNLRGIVAARQMPVASVFIDEFVDRTRLRVSFAVRDTSTGLSGAGERTIQEESVYVAFFDQIENELSLRSRETNVRHRGVQTNVVTANRTDSIDRNLSEPVHEADPSVSQMGDDELTPEIGPPFRVLSPSLPLGNKWAVFK